MKNKPLTHYLLALTLAMAALLVTYAGAIAATPARPMAASGVTTFRSFGKYDGYVREYMDDYWYGNVVNSNASTIYIGDDTAKRLVVGILDFDTSSLPDTATITYATLEVRVTNLNLAYGDPYMNLGDMHGDIISGYFGTTPALESMDFEWWADSWAGTFSQAYKVGQWVYFEIDPTSLGYVNLQGRTQFKLYFVDDNEDVLPQGITIASGNNPVFTYRPKLVIYFDTP